MLRMTMLATVVMVTGCGGTTPFDPEPSHSPLSTEEGYVQCLAQEGADVGDASSLVVHERDGAVAGDYYTAQQCQAIFTELEAGAYTGP